MARNPDLVRAILAQPTDDNVRLVYADWLDEHGDPKHAELIRVQCELARKDCPAKRKKQLQKRESELLADPVFHLPGQRPFQFERGFIYEGCMITLTVQGVRLGARPFGLRAAFNRLPPLEVPLDLEHISVLDRGAALYLNLSDLPSKKPSWDDPLTRSCLQRVTNLVCYEGTVRPNRAKCLTKCPHLSGVTAIDFNSAGIVPLPLIAELFLSTSLPNVEAMHLDGEDWFADGHTHATEDDVAAFVTRLGASPKAAQLTYFQLNFLIGDKTARALLDAPHLHPAEQLCLPLNRGLRKPMKDALKKRFGKALIL